MSKENVIKIAVCIQKIALALNDEEFKKISEFLKEIEDAVKSEIN